MLEEVLIHIGYQKTGSTWLQNELFTSDSPVFEPLSMSKSGKSTLSRDFFKGKDDYLLSPFITNREFIERHIEKIVKSKTKNSDKQFVFSSERLCGSPHSGGIDARIIANRLALVFPNGKILIVIREQKDLIRSLYCQYLSPRGGGLFSIKKYLNAKGDGQPSFSPHFLDYVPLIQEYIKLFGKQNVLVLPYELFREEPEEFLESVGEFLDREIPIDEESLKRYYNVHSSTFVLIHFRFLNRFVSTKSSNNYSNLNKKYTRVFFRGIQEACKKITPSFLDSWTNRKLEEFVDQWVGERYVSANKELGLLINRDLSIYNYY